MKFFYCIGPCGRLAGPDGALEVQLTAEERRLVKRSAGRRIGVWGE